MSLPKLRHRLLTLALVPPLLAAPQLALAAAPPTPVPLVIVAGEAFAVKPTLYLTHTTPPERPRIAPVKRRPEPSTSDRGRGFYLKGWCTYGVALLRPIPAGWGNAINWYRAAERDGYAVGTTPSVGAIMVTRESRWGHVAYTTAVHDDGSWTVKEMNYTRFGVYSTRTVRRGSVPLVGFIYER